MRRAIRQYGGASALIVVFMFIAILAGGFILVKERLQLPFRNTYTIKVAFPNSLGLVPGQGEPANVAGVQVGQITGAVLQSGTALVTMTIDRNKLPRIYSNAQAQLYANTPLEDMEVNIEPGGPPGSVLTPGKTIALANTSVPFHSQDFFNSLDGDTRQYVASLLENFGGGFNHQGNQLRSLLLAFSPTLGQVSEFSKAFAARQAELKRVIHNLSTIALATSHRDSQFGQLIEAGNTALHALSSQDVSLSQALHLFPQTLADTRQTLADGSTFASQVRPTLESLQPAIDKFQPALAQAGKLAAEAVPFLSKTLTPLVNKATPVFQNLQPAVTNLTQSTPDFTNVAQVFQYFANEVLYDQGGNAHSFAFWLGWFSHNAASTVSTGDVYGSGLRTVIQVPCSVFQNSGTNKTPLGQLLYLVVNTSLCPSS